MAWVYHITDIGQVLSGLTSQALAVNNAGVVVGSCHSGGKDVAFRYQYPGAQLLSDPSGAGSIAMGINNGTQERIVGQAGLQTALWSAGVFSSLVQGFLFSEARDINGSGIVVGTRTILPGVDQFFVLDTNTSQETDFPLGHMGFLLSYGRAVNNQGVVVGWAVRIGLPTNPPLRGMHAFRYAGGVFTDLDTNDLGSQAFDINDEGFAVGVALYGTTNRAVLFPPTGGMRPLKLLPDVTSSIAYGVSGGALPVVVGEMQRSGSRLGHAFLCFVEPSGQDTCLDLYQAGVPTLPATVGHYYFHTVLAVDDNGSRIVGTASYEPLLGNFTDERAVLLTDPRAWPP
jgi:probable HAF family extracellular repeat protein